MEGADVHGDVGALVEEVCFEGSDMQHHLEGTDGYF